MTEVRTARSYWIFCLIFLPLVIFAAFDRSWNQDADIWETAAAIRAASQNLLHPANPLLPLPGSTSPRFTPFVILWAAVERFSGLGLFTVVGLAGIANYLLFVTGLAHWLTRETRQPKFTLVALLVMLTAWGTGYIYANAYQLGFFMASLAYAGTFTYGVCFHALAFLRRYLEGPSLGSLLAYAALSVLAFLTHPITAAFLFVAALAVLLPEQNWKRTVWMQAVPLACFAVSLLWPYFDYWTVLFRGSLDNWFPASLFKDWFPRMGVALAGIPLAIYFALRRRHLWAAWGVFLCTGIYIFSAIVRFRMGSRFLLYGAIFLHIAIALYLFETWPWWKHKPRPWLTLALALIVILPALPFRAREAADLYRAFAHRTFGTSDADTPNDRLAFLVGELSPADIVLAEDDTGWPLPALTGARLVSQQKGDPLIQAEILRRRQDAAGFFQELPAIEQRRELLQRYGVTHVLLDMTQRSRWQSFLMDQITQLATEQAVRGSIVLYRVRSQTP